MKIKVKITNSNYAAEMTYNQFHAIANYVGYYDKSSATDGYESCYKMLITYWDNEQKF